MEVVLSPVAVRYGEIWKKWLHEREAATTPKRIAELNVELENIISTVKKWPKVVCKEGHVVAEADVVVNEQDPNWRDGGTVSVRRRPVEMLIERRLNGKLWFEDGGPK